MITFVLSLPSSALPCFPPNLPPPDDFVQIELVLSLCSSSLGLAGLKGIDSSLVLTKASCHSLFLAAFFLCFLNLVISSSLISGTLSYCLNTHMCKIYIMGLQFIAGALMFGNTLLIAHHSQSGNINILNQAVRTLI